MGTPGGHVVEALQKQLRQGPKSAAQLMLALGISQPTFSRAIRRLDSAATSFRIPGERTPRYALLRPLPFALAARQRIYRVLSSGAMEPFADVEFLAGGGTLERLAGGAVRFYESLPPYMAFAAPSGFLGRQCAYRAALDDAGFPENLRDWREDHQLGYLFTRGLNLFGNLVFGEGPLQREIELRRLLPTPATQRLQQYDAWATAAHETSFGSSAGGEQPKFLAMVEDLGHVIVKFARRGSRMAQLLPMEHLALQALAQVGVPAARTQLWASAEHVFLEVQRFDRVGALGRVGMLSAGAVDDEFFGSRQTWSQFAARCEQERYISAQQARHVNVMAAFSELIGNNDRHFENLSLLIGDDGEYAGVAPAYDILPMRYASLGGGVEPPLSVISPRVGPIGADPQVWAPAAQAAESFWAAVQNATLPAPLADEFKALAAENLEAVRRFVEPLRPAPTPRGPGCR